MTLVRSPNQRWSANERSDNHIKNDAQVGLGAQPLDETFLTNWYFSVISLCVHDNPMGPICSNYWVRTDTAAWSAKMFTQNTPINNGWQFVLCAKRYLCQCYGCVCAQRSRIHSSGCLKLLDKSKNDNSQRIKPKKKECPPRITTLLCCMLSCRVFKVRFLHFIGADFLSVALEKCICNKLYLRDYGIIHAFIDINKIYFYL